MKNYDTYIKVLIFIFIYLEINSCGIKSINNKNPINAIQNCDKELIALENNAFLSCPISKGPDSVISFLTRKSGFIKNKEFDFGNGSVRFNAKNADFLGYKLKDEKSLFLLNYFKDEHGKDTFSLLQAIYFFENEEDKNISYQNIVHIIEEELHLKSEIKSTLDGKSYKRYFLSCGSGFNLKYTEAKSENHIIDILWMPDYANINDRLKKIGIKK